MFVKQPNMVIKVWEPLVLIFGIHSQIIYMEAKTNFIKFWEYINQWSEPISKFNLCVYINKYVCESYNYLIFDAFNEDGFAFFAFGFSVKHVNIVFIYHSCN